MSWNRIFRGASHHPGKSSHVFVLMLNQSTELVSCQMIHNSSKLHSVLLMAVATLVSCNHAGSVEPDLIDQTLIAKGRTLFQHEWSSRNPKLGGDGLGPLHNAKSCVACHHQGGVGGSGAARFNAKSIGIETLRVVGFNPTPDVVSNMLVTFHPGFVSADGVMNNSLPLHHRGPNAFLYANRSIMSGIPAEFSESGSPSNPEEVRIANATPILYSLKTGRHTMTVKARLFQRNTPALFGSGLIDQVTSESLDAVVKEQKSHPEISGRPSTLRDGRYGKFGWRANIASLIDFNDQACAAELGLETKRIAQPSDPLNPNYKNASIDITDDQIRTMTAFVKTLPAPHRHYPSGQEAREQTAHGEKLFSSIGCAVCHRPNLGQVSGIYSDLLLHDMGKELFDINAAEPHRVRFTPVVNTETVFSPQTQPSIDYLGGSQPISMQPPERSRDTLNRLQGPQRGMRSFIFEAATQPEKLRFVTLGKSREILKENTNNSSAKSPSPTRGRPVRIRENQMKILIEPTNVMQEWRTPPLWGVRDSGPYMHDGRATTLLEAVIMHGGEATGTRDRFLNLSHRDRSAIIRFMETLAAPPHAP